MKPRAKPTGMPAFTIVWVGQLISFLGSGLTLFAVSIWAWEQTGQATALALAAFFGFGPTVLLSPVAGALVDRWNRKLVMMLSDLATGVSTIALLILFLTGRLQIWHLFVANAFAGSFQAFQFPAYSAAVTMMLPKAQYARASGMLSLAESAGTIFAPLMAGALIGVIGIQGIMVIDIITFIIAILALLAVHVPQPELTLEGSRSRSNLWKESLYGFGYIFQRPSLLGLQLVFFGINLIATFGFTVMVPMILARTGNNELALGSVQSVGSLGGLVGGLLLSAWGGPRRRVHGVLLGMIATSLLGEGLMGLGRGPVVWAIAAFMGSFSIPILNGSNQAIWQAKVAPDVQGRVFATRRLIAQVSAPVAMLASGPLADHLFEPALREGGSLVSAFGWLVGTGPGAGMSLMFVLAGAAGTLIGLGGYLFPAIRDVEDLMPDHDASPALAQGSVGQN